MQIGVDLPIVGHAEKDMDRRGFIEKGLSRLFYVLGGIILAYPGLSFMTFKKSRTKKIVFHPDEQQSDVNFKEGVCLVRKGSDTYAFSMRCTHLGCMLNYGAVSQRFQCPCHGSVFDRWGKWVSGPAKKDLLRVPFAKKENKDIVVTLNI